MNMEQLTALIYNFNTDCYKQYTKVFNFLGNRLNESLKEIEINNNELRQRIIPIVKEMYDNNWTAEEAYELSANLKRDDIKDIFTKDYIIDLLKNIL